MFFIFFGAKIVNSNIVFVNLKFKSMKQICYLLVVVGLLISSALYSQTDVTIVYSVGEEEKLTIYDEGGLYFLDDQLLIATTIGDVKSVFLTDIHKLLLSESTLSVGLGGENKANSQLCLYPNPVADKLYLLGIGEKEVAYTIYSISGTTFFNGTCCQGVPLDLSFLSPGFYLLNVDGVILRFTKL